MIYLIVGHLGGLRISEEYIDFDTCETCGDRDECYGFETLEKLLIHAVAEYGTETVREYLGYEVGLLYRKVEE